MVECLIYMKTIWRGIQMKYIAETVDANSLVVSGLMCVGLLCICHLDVYMLTICLNQIYLYKQTPLAVHG